MLQIVKHFVQNNFFLAKPAPDTSNVHGNPDGIIKNFQPTNIIADISKKTELGELVKIFSPVPAGERGESPFLGNENDNLSGASDEKPIEIP